jgi:hypothetical protein
LNLYGFINNYPIGFVDIKGSSVFDPNNQFRKWVDNCWSYACGVPGGPAMPGGQGGRGAGDIGAKISFKDCADYKKKVLNVKTGPVLAWGFGLSSYRAKKFKDVKKGEACPCKWRRLSLYMAKDAEGKWDPESWHVMRRDYDLSWSHKPGADQPAQNTEKNSKKPITMENRHDVAKEWGYNTWCGDVCIQDETVDY